MEHFLKHLRNKTSAITTVTSVTKKSDKNKSSKIINLSKAKKSKEEIKANKDIKKINHDKKVDTLKMIEDWKDIMYQTGAYTSDNKTFTFTKIKWEEFGFKARLHCPLGLSFSMLETIQDKIENGLTCIFIYNKERLDRSMDVRIVTKITMDKQFSPPKTKPWEIYIGDMFDGTPIIVDLNKWCQVLLTGTTGTGKSRLLDCSMATQIHNHDINDLWLFLIQLDKNDLLLYKDANICKGFADDLDKAVTILQFLIAENRKRCDLVAPMKQKGQGSNITDYNRLHPNNKQPTIWIAVDEMASTAVKSSDSKETKEKKQIVDDLLSALAQFGRSQNIFLICCLQKPTAELLNSFIKSLCNLKIAFRASNSKSSEVATDDSKVALDLPRRVAVYKTLAYDFLQTPWIDDPLIMTFIKDKLNPNHNTIFNDSKRQGKDTLIKEKDNGKQDVSYELQLKQKEQEIIEREKALKRNILKLEKDMKKKEELLEQKENKFKLQRDNRQAESFDKLTPCKLVSVKSVTNEVELNSIVEENKKNIVGWVDWIPPQSLGKEKIVK